MCTTLSTTSKSPTSAMSCRCHGKLLDTKQRDCSFACSGCVARSMGISIYDILFLIVVYYIHMMNMMYYVYIYMVIDVILWLGD